MPDFPNRRVHDFSQYDAMDDGELQEILREDASKPEGEESDMELLLHVMEVLAKRRNERNEAKDPEAALKSFNENYCTDKETSLISDSAAKTRSGRNHWRRGLAAAAAVFALIIGCSATTRALGYDVWGTIVKWTQETFHFGSVGQATEPSAPSKDEEYPYAELREALQMYGVTQKLLPSWIPEGYVESSVKVVETPKQRQFVAKYECGDQVIKIQIKDYLDTSPEQIERSDTLEEIYESAGVQYYIFSDNTQLRAAWIVRNYECYISGPLTLSEIEEMIDSIVKG